MPPEKEPSGGGLSLQTLLISSAAAVAAAVIVPQFWERGSLVATAITPIIVAVVSELLNRPAKVIKTTTARTVRQTASRKATTVGGPPDVPGRETPWGDDEDPFGLHGAAGTPRKRRRFPWKLAIGTGLLAAVIGASVVTASELAIFGHSVGHSNRTTSVFGGNKKKATATPTATPTATEQATETPIEDATETATPEATETAAPTTAATATPPAATATPNTATTPVPTEATPVPTP